MNKEKIKVAVIGNCGVGVHAIINEALINPICEIVRFEKIEDTKEHNYDVLVCENGSIIHKPNIIEFKKLPELAEQIKAIKLKEYNEPINKKRGKDSWKPNYKYHR